MKRFVGVLFLAGAALALGADDKKDDAAKEELKKLEGTWLLVSAEEDGQKMPDNGVKIKAVVKGDKLTLHFGEQTLEGTISVDPSKKPKEIDTVTTADKKKSLGIYDLDGDTLKICVGKSERPKEFDAKKGSGNGLYV